jgi:hypothetical protein
MSPLLAETYGSRGLYCSVGQGLLASSSVGAIAINVYLPRHACTGTVQLIFTRPTSFDLFVTCDPLENNGQRVSVRGTFVYYILQSRSASLTSSLLHCSLLIPPAPFSLASPPISSLTLHPFTHSPSFSSSLAQRHTLSSFSHTLHLTTHSTYRLQL